MLKITLVLLVTLAVSRSYKLQFNTKAVNEIFEEEWEAFKETYGKKYESDVEEAFRLKVYMENRQIIARHSKANLPYRIEMNEFGDMLFHEFSAIYNGFVFKGPQKSSNRTVTFIPPAHFKLPETVDWRSEGAVTGVKNQKSCGSCWAFGAVGSLEGQQFRKSGILVSMSEQELVDCATADYNCHGCEGGDPLEAYQFLQKTNTAMDTEESYPYSGKGQDCQASSGNFAASVTGHVRIESGNEEALMTAVASSGPIVVAIDVTESLMRYGGGVYYEASCESDLQHLNHAVLVVGYGTEDGQAYWLIKNSWGSSWGEGGYIKMSRGRDNNCGIATYAGYPLV